MHKNKVILLLKSLSTEEIRQLDKFVCSPVHNQHEEVIRFFQYVRKYLHNGERALKRENVFAQLYPGEAFDMQRIHYLSSYLLKVLEEFLAWREWRRDEATFQLYLLRAYHQHRLDNHFESTFEKARTTLEKIPYRDLGYLQQNYRLELEQLNYSRNRSSKHEIRLQELSDAQDIAYIAEKLRNACILISNQAVVKATYDTGLLEQVIHFLQNHRYLEIPAIAIYYYASRALANAQDDEAFRELKNWLTHQRKLFNINELHEIYIFAINYCIRRMNSGEEHFTKEVFDIYQMGLETDAFNQNGIMTPRTYSNIIMAGLRLDEYDWVEKFILEYKNALPEKQREGFFNYNLARLHYERKNYKKAMPLLLQMEYEDVLLTCLGKILLVKMQFELNETEALHSHLQSFKTYVRRKKMLGYHRDSSLNFIYFIGKLMQSPVLHPERLQQEILETKVVAEKNWLLEQLAESGSKSKA